MTGIGLVSPNKASADRKRVYEMVLSGNNKLYYSFVVFRCYSMLCFCVLFSLIFPLLPLLSKLASGSSKPYCTGSPFFGILGIWQVLYISQYIMPSRQLPTPRLESSLHPHESRPHGYIFVPHDLLQLRPSTSPLIHNSATATRKPRNNYICLSIPCGAKHHSPNLIKPGTHPRNQT